MTLEEIETKFNNLQKNNAIVARAMMLIAHGNVPKEQALMLAVVCLAEDCEVQRAFALELLKRLPPESLRIVPSGTGYL